MMVMMMMMMMVVVVMVMMHAELARFVRVLEEGIFSVLDQLVHRLRRL
jgi:hypothetical protein